MRHLPRSTAVVALAVLAPLACADPVGAPLAAPVTVTQVRDADDGTPQNFQTHLAGDNEIPSRETLAQGNAKFQLSRDGETMAYKVIASNIDNAFMSHIHLGPAGANGPIVVWLRPTIPNGTAGPESQVRQDGVFAEGSFTKANFVGLMAGKSMADLVAAIQAGNAYVNVHTRNLAIPASQLEAGNFPGGEVRGQIDHGNGM